jgi:phospholipid/cholesterol/gamma-HCH transport system ATP-binding protein
MDATPDTAITSITPPLLGVGGQKPRIDLRDVRFAVDEREILKGITAQVEPGEVLCVCGLSGSGKSTLLKLISGLTHATSGEIAIDGVEITKLSERELDKIRAKMGIVFQYAALFDSMNVFDNIAFGLLRGPRRKENRAMKPFTVARTVAELLRDVGLPGIERRMPAELSGGMRRRVGLARALATQPETILYDEPTSGLDPVTAAAIDDLIVETGKRSGATSIVVSHDMSSILRIADRVLMIYEGSRHFWGTPEEFQNSPDPVIQQFVKGSTDGPILKKKK